MAEKTLKAMRNGGIFDHIGFGFHRYSVDEKWLVPHFEKMLYDQALLAMAYLEAYQVTADPFFSRTAREIFTYVLEEMTSDHGAFWTAEDADSEGEEGKFYVWPIDDVEAIASDGPVQIPWSKIFNLHVDGNFRDEASGQQSGANILYMTRSWDQWQHTLSASGVALDTEWEILRKKLFAQRRFRPAPLKDDRCLPIGTD